LGLLLSVTTMRTAGGSAVPIWMYLDNWTFTHLEIPGARRQLLQSAWGLARQFTLVACWSWAIGFLLGRTARRTTLLNTLALCLAVLFAARLLPGPSWPAVGGGQNPAFAGVFYALVFPVLLQTALALGPAVLGARQGAGVNVMPRGLRAVVGAAALISALLFIFQNWGWVWCWTGEMRACLESAVWLPALPFALGAPAAYVLATLLHSPRESNHQPPA
jgi:hypothetical protein